MRRLSGLDAAFLSLESPSAPMHVASLIVVDPSTVPGGFDMARARQLYQNRLHLAPPFRRRLVEVPFGVHHPVWIEDPDFDLDYHLRHIAVPAPGTMAELEELCGQIVSLPLDKRRPLWEVWLIEGIEGGLVGLLSKVHHAAIDGASGEELMVAILDLSPEMELKPPPDPPWHPERVPTEIELWAYALWSLSQNPFKMAKATQRTLNAVFNVRQGNRRPGVTPPPAPFSAPHTSFNTNITPHRRLSTASLSLPDVKRVKNAFGVTVNDVVLTLCGAGLRAYFDSIGEKPSSALVAMVPISVRTEDKAGTMGNQVSAALTTLATDIDDPVERLRTVSQGMRQSKVQHQAIGADTLQDWTEFTAPALAGRAARLYRRMKVADRFHPLYNVTISNVPGPNFPLYVAGSQVRAVYPMGPIYDGIGINITVMSYLDSLDFGINVCPELIPEPWRIGEGLHRALEELLQATGKTSPTGGRAPAADGAEPSPTPEPTPVADGSDGSDGDGGRSPRPERARPARSRSAAAGSGGTAATGTSRSRRGGTDGTRSSAARADGAGGGNGSRSGGRARTSATVSADPDGARAKAATKAGGRSTKSASGTAAAASRRRGATGARGGDTNGRDA